MTIGELIAGLDARGLSSLDPLLPGDQVCDKAARLLKALFRHHSYEDSVDRWMGLTDQHPSRK